VQAYDEIWGEEKVIELANKLEFENTGVQVTSPNIAYVIFLIINNQSWLDT
jgi:hypothetical protein